MNRVTAKERASFALKACETIIRAGGRSEPDDTGLYSWVIDTRCGPLYLHVSESTGSGIGFVAGRFLYPDRGVAVLGADAVNRFSGKWNHHYFSPWSVDEAVADFERSLRPVLPASDAHGGRSVTPDGDEPNAFHNFYRCDCGAEWEDWWSCACNDHCPKCHREIEPYESVVCEAGSREGDRIMAGAHE